MQGNKKEKIEIKHKKLANPESVSFNSIQPTKLLKFHILDNQTRNRENRIKRMPRKGEIRIQLRLKIHLPKDPSEGLKSSKAADRWASVIGWKTDAASQITITESRTRNPPRVLAAISATTTKTIKIKTSDMHIHIRAHTCLNKYIHIYVCKNTYILQIYTWIAAIWRNPRVLDREESSYENVWKIVGKGRSWSLRGRDD